MFKKFERFRVPLLLLSTIGLGFMLGLAAENEFNVIASVKPVQNQFNVINNESITTVDMEPFWKTWKLLDEKYVATGKESATSTSSQDRVWGAIQGLTDSLNDPYTVFMPPSEAAQFEENISGSFEGVGMEIGIKNDYLTVISPLKGSPAEKAGILSGDKIISIDGKTTVGISTDEAVSLIRGSQGTMVKISILRNGDSKPRDFNIIRAVIDIPTMETEIKGDVFIIRIYNFYSQATNQFKEAIREFIQSKKSRLILDLRGNPGGYLNAAVDMSSWFLPLGKTIVREDFGGAKKEMVYRSRGYDVFNDKLRIIILIDGGSASASEIMAGALQEHGLAKLVGTKTFGKGSVQELLPVTDDTFLKVTIAKWLTPLGHSISEGGLSPDYEVKISETDHKNGLDPQLDKAIELLR